MMPQIPLPSDDHRTPPTITISPNHLTIALSNTVALLSSLPPTLLPDPTHIPTALLATATPLSPHLESSNHLTPLLKHLLTLPDPTKELSLTLFLPGPKSSKLSRFFRLLANSVSSSTSSSTISIPTTSLPTLFHSLLLPLHSLLPTTTHSTPWSPQSVAHHAADHVAAACSVNGHVDFDSFGAWYNAGGYQTCPYLELLDLGKWSSPTRNIMEDIGMVRDTCGELGGRVTFDFPKTTCFEPLRIGVTPAGVGRVYAVSEVVAGLTLGEVGRVLESLGGGSERVEGEVVEGFCGLVGGSEGVHEVFGTFEKLLGDADLLTFLGGVNVFLKGRKSSKLSEGFDLFVGQDGVISSEGLVRFLRGMLTAVVAVTRAGGGDDVGVSNTVRNMIGAGSIWTAGLIEEYCGGEVTFEGFAEWYSEGGGYRYAPWLELVDVDKFLALEGEEEEEEEVEEEEEDEQEDEEEYFPADQHHVVFTFPLAFPAVTGKDNLFITRNDVQYVHALVTRSNLICVGCGMLGDLISGGNSFAERIGRERLLEIVGAVGGEGGDEVMGALGNVFERLGDQIGGESDVVEVIGGLCLFCEGDKSSKLGYLFELFDEESKSYLSPEECYGFLSSVLAAIMSCTSQGMMMEVGEMKEVVDRICTQITDMLVVYVGERGGSGVSFDEFGEWYNGGGFEYAPWLELLALGKWAGLGGGEEYYGEEEQEEEEGEEEDEMTEDEESWVVVNNEAEEGGQQTLNFTVKNNSAAGGVGVEFGYDAIRSVNELVVATGLCNMSFRDVCGTLIAAADGSLILSKYAFDEVIRGLIPAESMDGETRRRVSSVLSGVFYAFDRDGTATVNVLEFASGFSVFCKGNKSDKLAFAFESMDDDMDGRLSRRAMWRFARAFLTVLIKVGAGGQEQDEEAFVDAVDGGAVWMAASVFGGRGGNKGVLFDEFAEWYTRSGYRENSWLELLDLRKWCL